MARVNITIPDEVIESARKAGLNVSGVATAAIAEELDRRAKIEALQLLLRELDLEWGSPSEEDREAARRWADAAFGPSDGRTAA